MFLTVFLGNNWLTTKPKGAIIVVCGGAITPQRLKSVWLDMEFQTSAVKQEFWQFMFEMGKDFGDIQSFVVQDSFQQQQEGVLNV